MYREIEVGVSTVPMEANAATPIRYKMLFGKDLLTEFRYAEEDTARVSDCIPELAYIMAMQAAKTTGSMSLDGYLAWLEQFEPLDLLNAGGAIATLYTDNGVTTSDPKKKADRPSDK